MERGYPVAVERWELFEFEDQTWFPSLIRRYMQDCMEYSGNLSPDFYEPFVARLKKALAATGDTRLIDFGSGGAGPIKTIVKLMREREQYPITATLTDLHPNLDAFEKAKRAGGGDVDYVATSVDATRVPKNLRGFRFLSNAFHHFDPGLARSILASAVRDRQGIAIVESVNKSPVTLIAMPIFVLFSLLFAPLIRPFRWSRLFFTYIVPLVPLCVLFDGIASCLRSYSLKDLKKLTSGLAEDGAYEWEIGELPIGKTPMKLTYVIGTSLNRQEG